MTRVYEAWSIGGWYEIDADPSLLVLLCRLRAPCRFACDEVDMSKVSVRHVIRFKVVGWSVTLARPVKL